MNWSQTKPEDCDHSAQKVNLSKEPGAFFCSECGQVWVDGKPDGDIIRWVKGTK